MMVFWTGVAAGVVAGAPLGAVLVCIMGVYFKQKKQPTNKRVYI